LESVYPTELTTVCFSGLLAETLLDDLYAVSKQEEMEERNDDLSDYLPGHIAWGWF
jgi:hypothetical protein